MFGSLRIAHNHFYVHMDRFYCFPSSYVYKKTLGDVINIFCLLLDWKCQSRENHWMRQTMLKKVLKTMKEVMRRPKRNVRFMSLFFVLFIYFFILVWFLYSPVWLIEYLFVCFFFFRLSRAAARLWETTKAALQWIWSIKIGKKAVGRRRRRRRWRYNGQ